MKIFPFRLKLICVLSVSYLKPVSCIVPFMSFRIRSRSSEMSMSAFRIVDLASAAEHHVDVVQGDYIDEAEVYFADIHRLEQRFFKVLHLLAGCSMS